MQTSNRSKKNLILLICIIFGMFLLLLVRVGWIQIVKGQEYGDRALKQQTRDTPIEAERGTIYDTNGEMLAVSVRCYTIYIIPAEIGRGLPDHKKQLEINKTATGIAQALDLDKDEVLEKINSGRSQIKIAKHVDKKTADKVREKKLSGVTINADTKRSYPNGVMAANVLGMISDENVGQSGLELEYNKYLSGISGRVVNYTDTRGKQLSYSPGNSKYYQAVDGYSLVTTIDEVVQGYVEDELAAVMKKTKAERAMAIVMNPETGDIIAMAQNPTFDPNNPYTPLTEAGKAKFNSMNSEDQSAYLSSMWRNFLISDVYEPGSVFKLLTTAIALEEDVTEMDSHFYCSGSLTIAGQRIRCWKHPGKHGDEDLKEAVGNSCNPVFMTLASKIGIEKFYDYLENFGITATTEIDFPAEGRAILQSKDTAGPVGLATIGFGQGIAVTPIQLITAVSSLGNDGNLMKPRLVKEIKDADGNTIEKIEPKVERQTVSKETASELREIMTYVVDEGGGGAAAVKGYKVGGKTGTAFKAKNGKYSKDTFSSCLGMAPMDDPKLTILLIVDSPKGVKYGSAVAAPAVGRIMSKTLKYMNIAPDESSETDEEKVEVPSVTGKTVGEGIDILKDSSLKYDFGEEVSENKDSKIINQYPSAGEKVKKGTKVFLYNE